MPPSSKTKLITGIRGQEGSRLAELLLKTGHSVHGIKRRVSSYGRRPASRSIKNGIFLATNYGRAVNVEQGLPRVEGGWRCPERRHEQ